MAGGGTDPVLEVDDLHVRRGEAHVLQGVSFRIRPRRVTALLGRNGAGKTTTLMAILGLLPSTGGLRLDGEDMLAMPTHLRVRRGIGYVPEDREVFGGLTVAENLRLAARGPRADPATVHELFPDLHRRRAQRAGSLSGGQQQMVAIARAMLNENRVLLIDEPSKGLAPIVVSQVVDALDRASRDTTILLVDQNIRVAQRLATDALVLDHGTIVYSGSMQELASDAVLTRRYLGVDRSAAPPAHPAPGSAS
ncbi:ABC transporter ATP-binding protein [Streptomyces sp. NPDC005708]|uniref:ABC transporter ATP-binding protein n=1 Tax=Streptomyces sp. NPDC005708 TaxID=3154564 RepID=UPI0033DA6A62